MSRQIYNDIADRLTYAELRRKRRFKTIASAYLISQWVAGALVILIWVRTGQTKASDGFKLLLYAPMFAYIDVFLIDFGYSLMVFGAQLFTFAWAWALLWRLNTRDLHEFCLACGREITDDNGVVCLACGIQNDRKRLAR